MATITAKDVAALRAKTGIGMMECKKALVEADGDMDAAIKILREKGELKAESKMATRIAADGLVDVLTEGNKTAIVEVNTETDFVAKNETVCRDSCSHLGLSLELTLLAEYLYSGVHIAVCFNKCLLALHHTDTCLSAESRNVFCCNSSHFG